ncbi:MAG: addiction module protein [Syntrophaceticus schinkii]|jgi:putative addiction module component (TIGR02574 family)|nr:addiction module protein [Syntrophaceticus schinkii]MDD4674509.1 addiction module protein [Syntrophaceticus schinkii]
MGSKTNDLFTMIESLPIDLKTALVEKLLASMQPIQKEVDEEWKKTAEERISEIKTGNVKVIPGNEVFNEIKDKYGR